MTKIKSLFLNYAGIFPRMWDHASIICVLAVGEREVQPIKKISAQLEKLKVTETLEFCSNLKSTANI